MVRILLPVCHTHGPNANYYHEQDIGRAPRGVEGDGPHLLCKRAGKGLLIAMKKVTDSPKAAKSTSQKANI